jgi:hypothetical protein
MSYKNKILIYFLCWVTAIFPVVKSFAFDATGNTGSKAVVIEAYIHNIYNQIDFSKAHTPLDYEVFYHAYYGYINLRDAGKLNAAKQIITICDYSRSSAESRLWVIDLRRKKLLYNTFVAHGLGSGNEFASSFSNKNNSHKTSIGLYVTGNTYVGDCGVALKLRGMDAGYNDAAYDRGIVLHGSRYVNGVYIANKKMAGRSFGCPAVPYDALMDIIFSIENGTCLFMFFPNKEYLQTAFWLNKKWDKIPAEEMITGLPSFKSDTTSTPYHSSASLK